MAGVSLAMPKRHKWLALMSKRRELPHSGKLMARVSRRSQRSCAVKGNRRDIVEQNALGNALQILGISPMLSLKKPLCYC